MPPWKALEYFLNPVVFSKTYAGAVVPNVIPADGNRILLIISGQGGGASGGCLIGPSGQVTSTQGLFLTGNQQMTIWGYDQLGPFVTLAFDGFGAAGTSLYAVGYSVKEWPKNATSDTATANLAKVISLLRGNGYKASSAT